MRRMCGLISNALTTLSVQGRPRRRSSSASLSIGRPAAGATPPRITSSGPAMGISPISIRFAEYGTSPVPKQTRQTLSALRQRPQFIVARPAPAILAHMAERSIHLVGGVPLGAREVFELAGASFGPLAKRLPDGEKKRGWLRPQAPIIGRAPGMIPGGIARYLHMTNQRYRPAPGQNPDAIN